MVKISDQRPDFYLVVVAHPDDESMFFSPTIRAVLGHHHDDSTTLAPSAPPFHILSLSNGNYDGLGKIREVELRRAAAVLGIPSPDDHVTCLDVKELQDGPNEDWKADDVADAVWNHICSIAAKKGTNRVAVITFDERGVSGHPNHLGVCRGVRRMISRQESRGTADGVMIALCGLELVSITNRLTKYCPLMEWIPMLVTYVANLWRSLCTKVSRSRSNDDGGDSNINDLLYSEATKSAHVEWCSRIFQPVLIWNAMAAHRTQFVWYRRLSVLFSRFSYCNTLRVSPGHFNDESKKSR